MTLEMWIFADRKLVGGLFKLVFIAANEHYVKILREFMNWPEGNLKLNSDLVTCRQDNCSCKTMFLLYHPRAIGT